MISNALPWGDFWSVAVTHLALRVSWRSESALAAHLEEFAATEAGSALDMLKAAELCDEPELRRLFFRHAVDEARHAYLFRAAAARLDPERKRLRSDESLIRATRQNLFQTFGVVSFVAFVFLSERRAARQFQVIEKHFAHLPEIVALFERVLRDERFHVGYSRKLLLGWRRSGRRREVAKALLRVRLAAIWQAWRRSGRALGGRLSQLILWSVWLSAVGVLSLVEKRKTKEPGWQSPSRHGAIPELERMRSEV